MGGLGGLGDGSDKKRDHNLADPVSWVRASSPKTEKACARVQLSGANQIQIRASTSGPPLNHRAILGECGGISQVLCVGHLAQGGSKLKGGVSQIAHSSNVDQPFFLKI